MPSARWYVVRRYQAPPAVAFRPRHGSNSFAEAPDQIGWVIPAAGGLLLCGLKDGLYTFDPAKRTFAKLMAVPGEPAHNRNNDACTDPWGRVWLGTMDDTEKEASGRFYVFDRGEVRAAGPSGISITNGPAVNADGTRIYFTDTTAKKIMVADLTREGVGERGCSSIPPRIFPTPSPMARWSTPRGICGARSISGLRGALFARREAGRHGADPRARRHQDGLRRTGSHHLLRLDRAKNMKMPTCRNIRRWQPVRV